MEIDVLAESQNFVQRGIQEQNKKCFDNAGMLFWKALSCLDQMPVSIERRQLSVELAGLFRKAGHEDLALLAIQEAIQIDEQINEGGALASDMIFLGNIHDNLENIRQAEIIFQLVIKNCLASNNFADAASASTNLAAIYGNNGQGERVIPLLSKSLEYLSKKSFPDTEFHTHVMLIQAVVIYHGDPALAVKSGIAIEKKFQARLDGQYRNVLAPRMQQAVDAYLKKEKIPDPEVWMKSNLSWVYQ